MSKLACLTTGKDRAFPAFPRVDRYFPAAAIEESRQRIARCIDRGDGPALVIGPTGTGKTLVLQLLATQFADRFSVACLTSTPDCKRRDLLQSILFELRQSYRDRESGELRLSLVELLLDRTSCPNGLLLLVDEAHLLSTNLLEELRVLGNLTRGGEPQVRLVLAGSLQLDESFTSPELEIFSQRISTRCYLAPLSHQELVQYVRAQISSVGAKPDELIQSDALDALYQATDGIPRLVNQLCDRALLLAIEKGLLQIDKSIVETAWADLQQLPTPWIVTSESISSSSEEIEFGSLGEEVGNPLEFETAASPAKTKQVESEEVEVAEEKIAVPASRTTAPNPFEEPFQEEEMLLDRFASLESAVQPSTPRVRNQKEPSWSQLLQDADDEMNSIPMCAEVPEESSSLEIEVLPDSESVETVDDYFDEPLFPQFSSLLSPPSQKSSEPSASRGLDSGSESYELEIEEDAPAPALVNRQVRRREFRQLFASLRGD